MIHSESANMIKNAAGAAGGAALIAPIAPIAPPLIHGLAGIAVVGLGIFDTGALILKGAEALKETGGQLMSKRNK
ncbi:MAG: hypothetical protein HGB20_01965 [Chlorobiaceae bacterium]|nr:hypothetical protein [Chlorobiaceae bacterium]